MRSTLLLIATCTLFGGSTFAAPGTAPGATGAPVLAPADATGSAEARALLERAVTRYRADGDAALAAFSRVGEFQKGDLYVYVLGTNGIMLAAGGASTTLIGRNISDLKDTEGKAFIREMLEAARTKGSGTVKYRWLNRQHGKTEQKVAYFQTVGDKILVVGYYVPRASAEQAQAMLWRAVHELKQDDQAAIRTFNDLNGGFVQDDLYVFIVGIDDLRMYAHGAQPRLIGQDVAELQDANGKPIIKEMVSRVKTGDAGELTYAWQNPVTRQTESKTTYFRRVGRYLVAVGAYSPAR